MVSFSKILLSNNYHRSTLLIKIRSVFFFSNISPFLTLPYWYCIFEQRAISKKYHCVPKIWCWKLIKTLQSKTNKLYWKRNLKWNSTKYKILNWNDPKQTYWIIINQKSMKKEARYFIPDAKFQLKLKKFLCLNQIPFGLPYKNRHI